jgi:hypothetical protein
MCVVVDSHLAQVLIDTGWVDQVGQRSDGSPIIDVGQKNLDDGLFEVVGKDDHGPIYEITDWGFDVLGPGGFEVLPPEVIEAFGFELFDPAELKLTELVEADLDH